MAKITVEVGDLKAALSLLKAYAKKEKAGGHFKDDEQRLPDAYYFVRVAKLEAAVATLPKIALKAKGK
jgi:hypothetical protein